MNTVTLIVTLCAWMGAVGKRSTPDEIVEHMMFAAVAAELFCRAVDWFWSIAWKGWEIWKAWK